MADRLLRMPDQSSGTESLRELRVRIRRSATLDRALKRRWLEVLPHLSQADRERLRQILAESAAGPPSDDS